MGNGGLICTVGEVGRSRRVNVNFSEGEKLRSPLPVNLSGLSDWVRGGERGEASHDCEGRREPGGAAKEGTGKVFPPLLFFATDLKESEPWS